jgi:undecaprenyl diphosphate synthase
METLSTPITRYFSELDLNRLQQVKVPRHIALILDGNRRYAKKKNLFVFQGHQAGADIILDIVKAGKELGIKTMTLFVFSTENWNRSVIEVSALMQLFESFILRNIPEMLVNQIRFDTIGEIARFPEGVKAAIVKAREATKDCTGVTALFAMNYGARNEILRAVQKIAADVKEDALDPKALTEESIGSYLDTAGYPDPDLLIRTAGVQRISNFLLWQLSYAELYITEVLWPEFTPHHLLDAVVEFQTRERRLGA